MTNSRPRLLVLGAITFVVVSAGFLGPVNVASSGAGPADTVEEQAETTTPDETTPDVTEGPVLRICERTIEGETTHILSSERYVPLLQQRGWSCSRVSPVLIAELEDGIETTPGEAVETPTPPEELPRVSLLRVCERRIDGETVLIASPEEDLSLLRSEGWSCGLHLPVLIAELEDGIEPVETPGNETEATTE